ncbi:MAG: UPF0147 family protein [Nitrososphaerota archaeon]|jgi:uncharacterized protein (UPF0147 family)|nr:UPF0147 family protein [Nitrososphaerota archaeon]
MAVALGPRRASHTQTDQRKRAENEGRLIETINTLRGIADSYQTPADAKKAVRDSLAVLRDTRRSIGERAANAISILDELAQNPKIPSYTRVGLWTALSKLETIRE